MGHPAQPADRERRRGAGHGGAVVAQRPVMVPEDVRRRRVPDRLLLRPIHVHQLRLLRRLPHRRRAHHQLDSPLPDGARSLEVQDPGCLLHDAPAPGPLRHLHDQGHPGDHQLQVRRPDVHHPEDAALPGPGGADPPGQARRRAAGPRRHGQGPDQLRRHRPTHGRPRRISPAPTARRRSATCSRPTAATSSSWATPSTTTATRPSATSTRSTSRSPTWGTTRRARPTR